MIFSPSDLCPFLVNVSRSESPGGRGLNFGAEDEEEVEKDDEEEDDEEEEAGKILTFIVCSLISLSS